MHLEWLEDFVELSRTRSFTRAAENRFVTHPAFGRRIRALEEWAGTPLIARTKPLTLTPAGSVFLDAATNMLETLYGVREQLQGRTPALENNIRIATGRTLASIYFPEWYENATRSFGHFTTTVMTGSAQEAIMHLMAGEVDLLIIYSSPHTRLLIDHGRFDFIPVARDTLVPVSALDTRGRARYKLPSGAEPIPWLSFARSLSLRVVLARHLAQMTDAPLLKPVYQSDSYESIMQMAKRGIGLAWLPHRLVRDDVARGQLAIVGNTSLRVHFDIAMYRQRNVKHPVLDKLWRSMEESLRTPSEAIVSEEASES